MGFVKFTSSPDLGSGLMMFAFIILIMATLFILQDKMQQPDNSSVSDKNKETAESDAE